MQKTFRLKKFFQMVTKRAVVLALVAGMVFSQAGPAFAARSGGRAGGFRAPAPSRTVPRGGGGSYGGGSYGGGYYGGGGGFGFPFMLPFFFGGGGGLFSLLIFMAIASFLVRAFQNFSTNSAGGYDGSGYVSTSNPAVTVAKVQVGLLAQARELQPDLDRIAQTSDTSNTEGLAGLLQESVLALLRHPEYWAYACTDSEKTVLTQAETVFNRVALGERSKLAAETLSNYNGQVRSLERALKSTGSGGNLSTEVQEPGEYIVVTLVVAAQGKVDLPQIQNAEDLRKALRQAGSISSDQLLGVELLWEPQANGDVLSGDDLVAEYPEMRIVA
ncbi:MAG: DUF1517 domain-containing protein [Synechococcales cyanobacterium RU_4_20]|nr:DUF1517 domain-containing protein [Synechococcales cyanobacterium RU_4_20]NJR69785.1 DUF1517 domain-containing protein [Synechococcales cyanobacterium CRU_2_2]